jgi:5-methylcytosine-specific restriction endonuclease McrA
MRSVVDERYAPEMDSIQRRVRAVRLKVDAAARREPCLSRIAAFFGFQTTYRSQALAPLQLEAKELQRRLHDTLTRRKQEYKQANEHGASEYRAAHSLRKQEAEARVERVLERKRERRIRYLERSPAIRSAARFLKRILIKQHAPDGELSTCFYCDVKMNPNRMHLEHKIPVSRGGGNQRGNLALACPSCNLKKGRKTHEEFLRDRDQADL